MGWIFQRESHVSSLDPSREIQAYPFPYKINFPDFYCLFNLSWYQMGRGRVLQFLYVTEAEKDGGGHPGTVLAPRVLVLDQDFSHV